MKRISKDAYELSTGKIIRAHRGLLRIDHIWVEGDSIKIEGDSIKIMSFSCAERKEIALEMIECWKKWGGIHGR